MRIILDSVSPFPHVLLGTDLRSLSTWGKALPLIRIPAILGFCSLNQSNMCVSPGHSHEGLSLLIPSWLTSWSMRGDMTGCWSPSVSVGSFGPWTSVAALPFLSYSEDSVTSSQASALVSLFPFGSDDCNRDPYFPLPFTFTCSFRDHWFPECHMPTAKLDNQTLSCSPSE